MKICHVLRVYQQFSTKWYYFITAHRRRHLVLALTRSLGKSSEKFHASRSTSSRLHTTIFQTLPFRSFLQIRPSSWFLPGPSWLYYLSGPPRGLSLVVPCDLWLAVPFGPHCGLSLAVPRGLWLAVPRGLWLAVPRGLWLAIPRGLWLAVLVDLPWSFLVVPLLSLVFLPPTYLFLPLTLSVALPYCLVMLHMYTPWITTWIIFENKWVHRKFLGTNDNFCRRHSNLIKYCQGWQMFATFAGNCKQSIIFMP